MSDTEYNDWSQHFLAARKALANLEAALCLRRYDIADHESLIAQLELTNLRGWLSQQQLEHKVLDMFPLGMQP